jgi:hypothetical protein
MDMHALGTLFLVLQVGLPHVEAVPIGEDPIIISGNDKIVYLAEHPDHRITNVVLCIFYAFLLALAQGESILLSLTRCLHISNTI